MHADRKAEDGGWGKKKGGEWSILNFEFWILNAEWWIRHPDSLIRLVAVPQPSGCMPAPRIVMGPVDHPAFRVPLVLTMEDDAVADLQILDSRSNVNVVSDQEGLPGSELDDEALMTAPLVVVGQYADDRSRPIDLTTILTGTEGDLG